MPDISMCANQACPSRFKCYRYRAIPSEWQSYMEYEPEGNSCRSFWPLIEGRPVRALTLDEIEEATKLDKVFDAIVKEVEE